jgi:hypothetical protein
MCGLGYLEGGEQGLCFADRLEMASLMLQWLEQQRSAISGPS